ncbi:MAG: cytochrome c maturation protein CcmE [Bacteroidia bacterium]|nr:cytochrome c maturation protein CcmE [Bacteroidia bacterium]MDW8014661.1 cytochrome c maturation protein CcmE [Bacteroidia bacterium]
MRLLIAALGVGLALTLLLMSLGEELTIYTDFRTAAANPTKTYHIIAEWVERELSYYEPQKDAFYFRARDTLGNIRWVMYPDPKPINFDAAYRVVLIGQHRDSIFYAEKILMKCPSKYKEEKPTSSLPLTR